MSNYGDQTHSENLDSVGQLEIGQAGNFLNHPRISALLECWTPLP